MKIIKTIISGAVWTFLSLYLLLVILLHIPAVQGFLGQQVSDVLGEKLGTEVRIGKVNIGLFNRLIIDDVVVFDQQGKEMLCAARLSVKVNPYSITQGKIIISAAQLFGVQGSFYQKDPDTPANYQFALDSLASKDTTQHTPLDLRISSLIIRRGRFRYDRLDQAPTHGRLNPHHLDVKDISAHILLPYLTDDSLETTVKRLSLKESAGLNLQGLSFHLKANQEQATIKDFSMKLPSTEVSIDSIGASYDVVNGALSMATLTYGGEIVNSKITPCDIACFEPSLQSFNDPLTLSSSFSGTSTTLRIDRLSLNSSSGDIDIKVSGGVSNLGSTPHWFTQIDHIHVNGNTIETIAKDLQGKSVQVPEVVTRLGDIDFRGQAGGVGVEELSLKGTLLTDAGTARLSVGLEDKHFSSHVDTDGINLRRVLDNEKFGNITANIDAHGVLQPKGMPSITMKGDVHQFDFNGYSFNHLSLDGTYQDSTFDGNISLDDPNGDIDLSGMFLFNHERSKLDLTGTVRHLNPKALHLTDQFEEAVFDADIDADLSGSSINNINGVLEVNDFKMTSETETYQLDNLYLLAANEGEERFLTLKSDFGKVNIRGQYDYTSLPQSFINFIGSKLPTLPGLPKTNDIRPNNFSIQAEITKSDWLNTLLDIPASLKRTMTIEGEMNDREKKMNMTVRIPSFSFNDGIYENGIVSLRTSDVGELLISSHLRKIMDNGHPVDLTLNANAANNELITSVSWDNNQPNPIKGTVNSTTEFFQTDQGKQAAHMRLHYSEILVNDTVWHVQPSDIIYSEKNLLVDYFAIQHNKQHIIVSGKATENVNDSIIADLQDVDLGYLMNIVNFHAVEFDGKVSGKASIKSVFKDPDAHADLTVNDFRFQTGRMGTLFAKANWNKEDKQIDIDAHAEDVDGRTLINGFVSPSRNEIDLAILARNTRLEFLQDFCDSFMANVKARGTGDLRLAGDLDMMNLTGMMVANGPLDITTLNTRYVMQNDTVRLIPNEIIFRADTLTDRNGNRAIINGALHHKHLTQLTFDLDIRAEHLLCYDFPDYGDNTFYGTVYATGNCTITGRKGRIDFDISGTPERGSFIEYNAASPDAISSQEFITWRDKSLLTRNDEDDHSTPVPLTIPLPLQDIPTDIYINFLINATPDFTLRVLMDQGSGDYIALNGNGALRATYYNKGSFDMFGNYLVDHGIYKLTIQNVIKKDFQFQQGGSIVFGGDPYHAALNLKALYSISGVPLSDLQIGSSFSENNVRVDCIMNIIGSPESPQVEFDIDLPTVNSDAKQMVRSLINGEEEMNQQVIYLLGIGRFYTQDANNASENASQSQTSLAMQSLLSGTISQQINSVLSSFVNSSNWNFGANISTGNEGWNNAEYEGLLSGRLLNNRLLINGQFGYRDNANATTSFIGDFDVRYLLFPNGNLAIRVYNQTNDRYFTRNSLTTQGLGLILKKDFNTWRDLLGVRRKEKKNEK